MRRAPRIEEVEAREVRLILWRERALLAEAQARALEAALSEVLETYRRDPGCKRCAGRGFLELDEGEYGSYRHLDCPECGGGE